MSTSERPQRPGVDAPIVESDSAFAGSGGTVGVRAEVVVVSHDGSGNPQVASATNPLPAALVSGKLLDESGNLLTVKRAVANVAASQTDSSIIAAVASRKLRILAVAACAGGTATNLTFNSKGGGAGTAISPLLANGVNGGEVLPLNPYGWLETNSGEGLTVTTGAGSTTGILVIYCEVP